MAEISRGHKFGVYHYRTKKLGRDRSPAFWEVWFDLLRQTIGREAEVDDMTDAEAVRMIDAMKALPDYGQLTMGLEV